MRVKNFYYIGVSGEENNLIFFFFSWNYFTTRSWSRSLKWWNQRFILIMWLPCVCDTIIKEKKSLGYVTIDNKNWLVECGPMEKIHILIEAMRLFPNCLPYCYPPHQIALKKVYISIFLPFIVHWILQSP